MIIGGAFTAIVTAFSDKIINPLIAAVGGAEGPALSFQIKENVPETTIDLGAVITAAINSLIVAAIVYFIIIVPMNKLNELRKRGAPQRKKFLRPPRTSSATSAKSSGLRRPPPPVARAKALPARPARSTTPSRPSPRATDSHKRSTKARFPRGEAGLRHGRAQ